MAPDCRSKWNWHPQPYKDRKYTYVKTHIKKAFMHHTNPSWETFYQRTGKELKETTGKELKQKMTMAH